MQEKANSYAECARKLTGLQEVFKAPGVLQLHHADQELLQAAQAHLWRSGFAMAIDRSDISDSGLTVFVYPQGCFGDGWTFYVVRSSYLDELLRALATI